MNRPSCLRPVRFLRAALPACLLLTACDPVDDPSAAVPSRFKAPLPEPRRTATPNPDNARWLAAWRELRSQLAPLEKKLADLQQVHLENHFDSFLDMDPETIDKDQLCTLFHFLERGYFTVERRILLHLLERRAERASEPAAIPAGMKSGLRERIIAAMQSDELRMVDLETALDFYGRTAAGDIQIPETLTPEEESELRTTVAGMLDETRESIDELDAKITALRVTVFGESSEPALE